MIRILIVDDHTLMRSGLKLMLSAQNDILVIGEAEDGGKALERICADRPDVVLLDVSMPGMNGLECLKQIKDCCPEVKIILLTMYEDLRYLREGLALGASGYVLKKAADDVLYQAIRMVCAGEIFIHGEMARALADEWKASKAESRVSEIKPLSEQERRVLGLIARGYSNQEIAEQLVVSVKTVETYKYRIMEKLQTRKRSDLVKYAVEHELT
jgi:DNA-binding NarL/FixJ family response regulator